MMNYSASIYPWAVRAPEIITMSPNLIKKKATMAMETEKEKVRAVCQKKKKKEISFEQLPNSFPKPDS